MLPELHPQWRSLDFTTLFATGAAFVNTDAQNSILDPDGVLSVENIWRGAREQGGSLYNILRLAAACRGRDMPFLWLRYDRFIGALAETLDPAKEDNSSQRTTNIDRANNARRKRTRRALAVRRSPTGSLPWRHGQRPGPSPHERS